MKKLLLRGGWLLVTLAGLYLLFIEVGMAISESHALRGANILIFAVLVGLGLSLSLLGLRKLRGDPAGQSNASSYSSTRFDVSLRPIGDGHRVSPDHPADAEERQPQVREK